MRRLRMGLACIFSTMTVQALAQDELPPASQEFALASEPTGRSAVAGARIYREAAPSVVMIRSRAGMGSGVVIDAAGDILTNLHVVGDSGEVEVIFKPADDGAAVDPNSGRKGAVVRRDEVVDLALVRVADPPAEVRPLEVARGRTIAVGSNVHAIGHPTGDAWTYTRGFVSQVRRDYVWRTDDHLKHRATVIQTQTPISPGSSGGPLLDDRLRVVGINTFTHDGEGLHFAISAEEIQAFLSRTDDRRAERDGPPAGCVTTPLKTWVSDDPRGEASLVDEDCDGEGDYQIILPADRRQPALWLYDTDGDGRTDMTILDRGRDGAPDEVLVDTDGDGKADLKGWYRRGEEQPYRIERIRR